MVERLDGAGAISALVAMGKAQTSAVTKRPTNSSRTVSRSVRRS